MHVCFYQSVTLQNHGSLANWQNTKRKKKAKGRIELRTHSICCTQQRGEKTGRGKQNFKIDIYF